MLSPAINAFWSFLILVKYWSVIDWILIGSRFNSACKTHFTTLDHTIDFIAFDSLLLLSGSFRFIQTRANDKLHLLFRTYRVELQNYTEWEVFTLSWVKLIAQKKAPLWKLSAALSCKCEWMQSAKLSWDYKLLDWTRRWKRFISDNSTSWFLKL